MNPDRERALIELSRRNPFWVCLLVFALLAADSGFRLADAVEQRQQLDRAELVQAQNTGRLAETLANLPQIEAKLQALSLDLIRIAATNGTALRIVHEFNIQYNPGPEELRASAALPAAAPAAAPPAAKTNAATRK